MSDPARLQDAVDEAMRVEIGAQFHALIAHLVDAEVPQPKGEPVRIQTQAEAVANFIKMVRLIWKTYNDVSPIEGLLK